MCDGRIYLLISKFFISSRIIGFRTDGQIFDLNAMCDLSTENLKSRFIHSTKKSKYSF